MLEGDMKGFMKKRIFYDGLSMTQTIGIGDTMNESIPLQAQIKSNANSKRKDNSDVAQVIVLSQRYYLCNI
jgi:hypothetical protein